MTLGCKDMGIRESEFMTKTQFLSNKNYKITKITCYQVQD